MAISRKEFRRIGVLTSGGDAPGMNPCIRAVVRTARSMGVEVLGIENGFEGLIHGNFRSLGARDVGGILQRGGTFLQTARCKEFMELPGQIEAVRQMNNAGMEAIVVIGGDGSLQGGMTLVKRGIPVVGIPASIDNDIFGTDMCIGVDTALNTIVDAIDKLRDTASSHNSAFLVETMGRHSGYLAIQAGIITGAEMILVPEVATPPSDVVRAIEDAYRRGKSHAIVVIAEGYEPHTADLAKLIDSMDIGFNTRVSILGHIQRGGKPSAFDRMLASRYGVWAVEALLSGQSGIMAGLQGREIVAVPLEEVISQKRAISEEFINMARVLSR